MRRFVPTTLALALGAAGVACNGPNNGTGGVDGDFFVEACRPSGDFERQDYTFKARHLDTKRVNQSLQILIQKHRVRLEEADGLLIHIEDIDPLQLRTERPLRLPISTARSTPSVALSLFDTCPNRPTLNMTEGELVFDVFDIAPDPDDTGNAEQLTGTLTGTVVTIDGKTIAGTLRASFDFEPEPRPVSEPQ